MMGYNYINGQFVPESEAKISIKDRGFRLGDAIFETIAVYNSIPYQWELHMERLKAGLSAIKIEADISALPETATELIAKNNLTDGILRIQITRGNGGSGYLPDKTGSPNVIIETSLFPQIPGRPVSLWLSSYRKIPTESLPATFKPSSSLNSVLARIEASENGCFEALMLNINGHICECSSSNVFAVIDGDLYTPPLSAGILPGTTREAIIRLSEYSVKQMDFFVKDFAKIKEIFITNVSWQIIPVSEIKPLNKKLTSHKMAKHYTMLLRQDIKEYVSARKTSLG